MSRYGGPPPRDDLAYGQLPERWDRDRFERFNARSPPSAAGGGRRFEEDYHFEERDRPGRRDILVQDRIEERGPRGRFEERDRYAEEDRYAQPARPRRRTDKELFGDIDPRELADMALTPYRRKSVSREEPAFERAAPPRPGLIRRQSSLDTFDRRPRYGGEDRMIPPFTPVPLPIRRVRDEGFEESRYRDYEPEDYREVEIQRERSVHRRGPARSKAPRSEVSRSEASRSEAPRSEAPTRSVKSVKTRKSKTIKEESIRESSSESSESFEEDEKTLSIHESIAETERKFKKGKTRMPKRLVRREAIMDLGYPFEEEENFFVLRIALEKEQIDEVIKISESYKEGGVKKVYRFEETVEQPTVAGFLEAPPVEREEVLKTEWINPPTVLMTGGARSERAKSVRAASPSAKSSISRRMSPTRTAHTSHSRARSRRPSSPGTYVEERRTVVEERRSPGPPPPPPSMPPPPMSHYESHHSVAPPPAESFYEDRRTIIEERAPTHAPSHAGTLVVQEREYRSDRDIQSEIRSLEAERRALRLEREAEDKREMAVRLRERSTEEDFQLVEYRERRPTREVVEFVEREKSPARNVLRVEKDRKEESRRKRQAKVVAAAMATLS